ncbi:DcaP family trimeric outer membrane transporter [Dyella sp. M7H15-1]|uniref:DcaP family trimeric outer membrane transporter n=1 Tax=Dyella sp. M7H15-1 TaxID=2501295 RepID=UPI0013E8DE8F|nr:DcaP family trimeric outer membrane transporter [Dyella sp. M7H15-1]
MFAVLSPALAQDQTQKLQHEVDDLQTTVKELQAEVKELRSEKAQTPATTTTPVAAAPNAPVTTAPVAPAAATALTEVPSGQVNALQLSDAERSPLPAQQSVSENQDSASRIDNEAPPTNPDLKGFVQIPGTETLVRLGGYAKLDTIYDTGAINSPDAFVTSAIPVPKPHDDSDNFTMQARQTRLSMEIRRPTIFDETLRFYFETDLFGGGAGNYGFRLRQAYGQLGNTFAGFGWSAFTDLDALPDTLDFEGPPGTIAPRRAGIHQFFHLGEHSSLTIAAEQPTSQVSIYEPLTAPALPIPTIHGTQHMPDLILAARTEGSWGHLQWGGVLRQLGYTDYEQSDRVLAGGAQLSGSFKVGPSSPYGDLLMFAAGWGKGIARYLTDTDGLNLDAIVGPDGKLHPLTGIGSHLAYTHYWSSNWRSNLVYGIARIQHSDLLAINGFHNSNYGALNLLWTPAPTFTAGIELLHGRLIEQDNRSNDDTRIQASIQYSFVK